jgi:hypothetical protein
MHPFEAYAMGLVTGAVLLKLIEKLRRHCARRKTNL